MARQTCCRQDIIIVNLHKSGRPETTSAKRSSFRVRLRPKWRPNEDLVPLLRFRARSQLASVETLNH